MQYWCGAALLPFADTIIESQQVGKALWVLEGRTLALGALDKRDNREEFRQCPARLCLGKALVSVKVNAGQDLLPLNSSWYACGEKEYTFPCLQPGAGENRAKEMDSNPFA